MSSSQFNYLIVSDLHLSEGINPQTGKLSRNEDFFHDDAFAEFLVYHVQLSQQDKVHDSYQRPWKLIINGDFLEYLQITSLPDADDPIWQSPHLSNSGNTAEYGLGTSEVETVWKTRQIVKGHPLFFYALGWFLAHPGNEIILLKGNHDVEMFWPGVQTVLKQSITEQYRIWHHRASNGRLPDAPLPFTAELPSALPPNAAERIHFPAWYYYEPELLFVEHGGQYDPFNAFNDFENPTLPGDKSHMVELPSGSFFVRYVFNKIEQIHPFADNITPLSKYLNWVISKELGATVTMLLRNPRTSIRSALSLLRKRGKFGQSHPQEKSGKHRDGLSAKRVHALLSTQEQVRVRVEAFNSRVTRGTVIALLMRGLTIVSIVMALKHFIGTNEATGLTAVYLIIAAASFVTRQLLNSRLQEGSQYINLPSAAAEVAEILNRTDLEGPNQKSAQVQFHVFGHDHAANIHEIILPTNQRSYRQWYVNTGSWLPIFNEQDRITRNDLQLTFLRIVPSAPGFATRPPQLLEWLPERQHPVPVRSLADQD